ncbi:hypothetical protein PTMSG1_07855 [Pyrenophora teres f. maculata]|nr:hypothetical protein PTMSG1_07855 [Pyrenophora teres f. maculata]
MLYARISGEVLSNDAAQRHHDFLQIFINAANFAISSHQKHDLTSQKQSTWSIRKSSDLDPLDEAVCLVKGIIHSRHVGLFEDWLNIRRTSSPWPSSKDKNSPWNTISCGMARQSTVHSMRNWFSHAFGTQTTSLETENGKFDLLLKAYSELLPTVKELLKELKDALDDSSIWATTAQESEGTLPVVMADRLATQNKLQAILDKSLAKRKQAKTTGNDMRSRMPTYEYTAESPSWSQRCSGYQ